MFLACGIAYLRRSDKIILSCSLLFFGHWYSSWPFRFLNVIIHFFFLGSRIANSKFLLATLNLYEKITFFIRICTCQTSCVDFGYSVCGGPTNYFKFLSKVWYECATFFLCVLLKMWAPLFENLLVGCKYFLDDNYMRALASIFCCCNI